MNICGYEFVNHGEPSRVPACECVYGLVCDDEVVYVGHTSNLRVRVFDHKSKKMKGVDFSLVYMKSENPSVIEFEIINKLNPKLNIKKSYHSSKGIGIKGDLVCVKVYMPSYLVEKLHEEHAISGHSKSHIVTEATKKELKRRGK